GVDRDRDRHDDRRGCVDPGAGPLVDQRRPSRRSGMIWAHDRYVAPARERPETAGAHIRLHRVYKVHHIVDTGVVALAGVDVEIPPGEFVAVVGPSGTGKSTILHLLGGLDQASAGIVEIDGQDLALLTDVERTRFRAERVGFVWQGAARNLVPYLTAAQNVRLPRSI